MLLRIVLIVEKYDKMVKCMNIKYKVFIDFFYCKKYLRKVKSDLLNNLKVKILWVIRKIYLEKVFLMKFEEYRFL